MSGHSNGGNTVGKKYLTKEEILGMADTEVTEVPVPEWGGAVVRIRDMTVADFDAFESRAMKAHQDSNMAGVRSWLVARMLVDQDGNRLFTEADADQLGKKNHAAVERIVKAIRRRNRLGAEGIEDAAKN